MLHKLIVRNVVLISKLQIDFYNGLVVFSGETGAGKSILLDALGLALGRRAETRLVGNNDDLANVTAEFNLHKDHPIKLILQDKGIPIDKQDILILRRELRKDGRSRAFINDQSVTIGFLRSIGENLVDIHGQNEKIGLLDPSSHLSILDEFGDHNTILLNLNKTYQTYIKIKKILDEALKLNNEKSHREDELKNSLEFLIKLAPKKGEERLISNKRAIMMKSEQISQAIKNIEEIFMEENNNNIISKIGIAQKKIENITIGDNDIGTLKNLSLILDRAVIELKEAEEQIEKVLIDVNYNPLELEEIEERLFSLRAAARRFNVSPDLLFEVKEDIINQLKDLEEAGISIDDLERKVEDAKKLFYKELKILSEKREIAAKKLSESINKEMLPLKLGTAELKVKISSKEILDWNNIGKDKVRFLVSMNKGADEGELHKVASGGELSRLMLAISLVLAKSMTQKTLVFDEIDAGVSGSVADAIGIRLSSVSKHQQVMVVTHLPQVAGKGGQHLKVRKHYDGNHTSTFISELDEIDRKEEIARMLSGESITDEARAAANILMQEKN